MFSLQVLGAVPQLERTLIAERTKAGMKAAKARGRLAGNPGLRERRPEAVRAIAAARERAYIDALIASAQVADGTAAAATTQLGRRRAHPQSQRP